MSVKLYRWYVRKPEGEELGPMELKELRDAVQDGTVPLDARVRISRDTLFLPLYQHPEWDTYLSPEKREEAYRLFAPAVPESTKANQAVPEELPPPSPDPTENDNGAKPETGSRKKVIRDSDRITTFTPRVKPSKGAKRKGIWERFMNQPVAPEYFARVTDILDYNAQCEGQELVRDRLRRRAQRARFYNPGGRRVREFLQAVLFLNGCLCAVYLPLARISHKGFAHYGITYPDYLRLTLTFQAWDPMAPFFLSGMLILNFAAFWMIFVMRS